MAKKHRTEQNNPQIVYKQIKEDLGRIVRAFPKQAISKIDTEIENLEAKKAQVLNNLEVDVMTRSEDSTIFERIKHLKKVKLSRTRDNTATRFFLEGETLKKYWINTNKESKLRDYITALKNTNKSAKLLV